MSSLINKTAVRAKLLEERRKWKPEENPQNVSHGLIDEVEEAVGRLIVGMASQAFQGRKGVSRG